MEDSEINSTESPVEKVNIPEPLRCKVDLSKQIDKNGNFFKTKPNVEITRLRKRVAKAIELSLSPELKNFRNSNLIRNNKNPIEEQYQKIKNDMIKTVQEKYRKPYITFLENFTCKFLGHKLPILEINNIKYNNAKNAAQSIYGLIRLKIIDNVFQNLTDIGISTSFNNILSVYRVEGDLAVPFSVQLYPGISSPQTFNLGLIPDEPIIPDWEVIQNFITNIHTANINKKDDHKLPYMQTFVNKSKEHLIKLCYKEDWSHKRSAYSRRVLPWLNRAKEEVFMIYLLLFGGLDFYARNRIMTAKKDMAIDKEHDVPIENLTDLFVFHYCRYRKLAGASKDKGQQQGKDQISQIRGSTDFNTFLGNIHNYNELFLIYYRPDNKIMQTQFHIVPIYPIDFMTVVITEMAVRFEALRRKPLPFMDFNTSFDPPLPPSVAYIRYNAWDIYFIVIVLEVLYTILITMPDSTTGNEFWDTPLKNVRDGLTEFTKKETSTPEPEKNVWKFIKDWWNWSTGEKLKEEKWRDRTYIINCLHEDAMKYHEDPYSLMEYTNEIELRKRLNDEFNLKSVKPIFDKMNGEKEKSEKKDPEKKEPEKKNLWNDFETVMICPLGQNHGPLIVDPLDEQMDKDGKKIKTKEHYGVKIGQNFLRFYFIYKGFAFDLDKQKKI